MAFKESFEAFKANRMNKKKPNTIADTLQFEINFTEEEINRCKEELKEFEKDLATYKKFKDLIKDREFKSQREFAKFILSLDEDIMKDYERVYGENNG